MTTSPITVIRTFGINFRYRYSLLRDGVFVRKLLSDNEAMFAIVYPDLTMELRRDSSEIRKSELEDPDTHIVTVIQK